MSQKVSRKTAVSEEKEKRQTDSPVKDMKKRMAANAEKEKQAAEKASEKTAEKKVEKVTEKKTEKQTEKKTDKPAEKATDKSDKPAEKPAEKPEKSDKQEKTDKSSDKKSEKQTKEDSKKSEPQAEKSKADSSKEDASEKPEKPDVNKPEPPKQKQNGRDRVHNGVSDVTLGTNGTDDVLNGTVSADSEDDDVMLVIDDNDHDELFPELTYEDNSDVEGFEVPTPENGPSRSLTRRSQVKATRTPETPRPASDKPTDKDADDPKDKVLKLKEDAHTTTDRRLRSSNSPKPQEGRKPDSKKDSPKKAPEVLEKVDEGKEEEVAKSDEKGQQKEAEVTIEVTVNEGEEPRKTDTNYSKSRVKVSPYRRSMRLADQTNTSVQANYTGNNTTMEMDITESSSLLEDSQLDDSSYLRGLRSIRGRSSYKPLSDITLRHVANRSLRSNTSATVTSPTLESHNRPTGTVVGRKRKPDNDDIVEIGVEATEPGHVANKRMRVLDRLAEPFRRVAAAAAMPTVARRNAEIVGINTDLPLSAPVSSADTFDPESLKQAPRAPLAPHLAPPLPAAPSPLSSEPVAVPLPPRDDRDNKRCAIM